MNLGKKVTFLVGERAWTLRPFSLQLWFDYCEWLKSRPRANDPLERVGKLPLDKLPQEVSEKLVREAIEEDRLLHDFRPESEATKNALQTLDGMVGALALLADASFDETRAMVLQMVKEDRVSELTEHIQSCAGEVPSPKVPAAEAAAA